MRILYIAKHNSGGNQDEDAIGYALEELGHRVIRLPETGYPRPITRFNADVLLFHKWADLAALRALEGYYYRVFWYFDLVDFPDPSLAGRCETRKRWMRDVLPHVELGFCTDGDWVARNPEKLIWLPQGADKRYAGFGRRREETNGKILFTGIERGGGERRESFVKEMRERYGERFMHIARGIHGEELAALVARASIVVAPDGPITDRYWSNRVYLTLGFGGFLLHPWCDGLDNHYRNCEEIVYYANRHQLHELIGHYLSHPEERARIALAGHRRTLADHTYHNRCAELIRVVQEKINAKHT